MKQLGQIKIGRYHIQSHLVRGGMADIYLAYDSEEDRIVAIKMVHESAGEYCERFQREVRAIAGLVHEHILPAFDYGQYESWYFLVTPYIEYGTLNSRLDAGPLTPEEVDPILAQLAKALQFAHEQGVVHRDVKPSNILMRDGNHVYLADFGLVKRVGQENGLTVTGYLIGTPEYMAPELAEEDATPQSDVYALGVLLYQMLTGRVPFKANTPMGVFLRHIRENPELPSTLNASIPNEVEEVILHAMEKDPQRRYQSAQELYLAYQQAVKNATNGQRLVPDQSPHILGNQIARAKIVDVRGAKQRVKVKKSLIVAALVAIFLLTGVFVVVSSAFFLGGWGNNVHVAGAQSAKNRNTSTPAVKHGTTGSLLDSAATNHSATGAAGGDVTSPVSTTNWNQRIGPAQQHISTVGTSTPGASSQSGASVGGSGQGTPGDTANGNAGATDQGTGSGGGGQSTGSSGNGTGGDQSTGSGGDQSSGSGNGQNDGNGGGNGNGGGGGNGHGGKDGGGHGKGNGGGGDGNGQGNGGNGQGNGGGGNGAGGGNGNGQGNGGGGQGNGGSGQGNGGGGTGPGNGGSTPTSTSVTPTP